MLYWFILGTIKLMFLTYQDIANKRMVDDRLNYFMMGCTVALIQFYRKPTTYLLLILVVLIVLGIVFNHFKLMGEADLKTILWSFYGFAVINIWYMAYYASIFCVILSLYAIFGYIFSKLIKKPIKKLPAYPIFLLSFVISYVVFVL